MLALTDLIHSQREAFVGSSEASNECSYFLLMSWSKEKTGVLSIMESKYLLGTTLASYYTGGQANKHTSELALNRPDFSHNSWEDNEDNDTLDAPR